jgi:hypothetical protein
MSTYLSLMLNRLEPILINTHKRSYFSKFEKTLRLTIDRELKFISPSNKLSYQSPRTVDSYNENLIRSFPVNKNLEKFYKFTTGVRLVH